MAGINLKNAHVIRALDSNGDAVSGAKLYVFDAGTTDAVTTYSDVELNTANAHPIVADSAGSWGAIYVPVGNYKVDVTNDAGTSLPGYPVDNVTVAGTSGADVETRNDVTSTAIDPTVDYIRTAGYATVGDGGAALYKRVSAEPSHNLKVQSADGAWWEIAEPQVITFQACGGVESDDSGNGAGNVTAFDNFIGYLQDGFSGGDDAKGPSLYFPIIDGSGVYHFDDHLNVKAAVHITGPGGWHWAARDAGPKLVFPVDNHGLIVHHYTTIDDSTEASGFTAAGSIIENLAVKGGGPGETTGHGVWVRGFCTLRHLFVEDFAEDGLHIVGTIGNGGADEGNVSTTKVENCTADSNGRHGFFWDGGDANACNNFGNEARDNGRWGFLDSSFLGNAHTGYHERRNGLAGVGGNGSGESSYVHVNNGGTDERYYAVLGASEADLVANQPSTNDAVWRYHKDGGSTSTIPTWQSSQPEGTYFVGGPYASDNANARNTFFGCYAEKSGGPPQMDEPAVVVGGHGMDEVVGGALYIGAGTDVPFIQTDNDFEFRVGRVLTVDGDHGTPRIELADSSDNKVYIVENGGLDFRTDAAINSVTFQDFGQSAGLASFTVRRATSTGGAGTVEDIASSTGTTGGSGSAGAGSQYVEINIDGTTFKVLHDGTL